MATKDRQLSTSGRASPTYRELACGGQRADRAVKRLRAMLQRHRGRIDMTAKKLKVTTRTLSRWLREHGLQRFASELRAKNHESGRRL